MDPEIRPLKTNQSFQSDSSSVSGLVEIPLSGNDFYQARPPTIYEESALAIPHSPPKVFKSLKPVENFDIALLPLIMRFLPASDLRNCQLVSWQVFKQASEVLYKSVSFSQLSGAKIQRFAKTLLDGILTDSGKRKAMIDYSPLVKYLSVKQIVFEEPSSLQSWSVVKDIIGLSAKTLVGLDLGIGDESFLDLNADYLYLTTNIEFPELKMLTLSSKCMKVPATLVLELLRAAPISKLKSVKFPRCMANFDASGWYLLAEKGGDQLTELVVTPSPGPNMLGWDEKEFNDGISSIASKCRSLSKFDLSGHVRPIPHKALEILCSNTNITELYCPCTINDAHLLIMMEFAAWENLKVLGMTCMCVDGEMREKKKDGMSCNRFTDHVLLEFLDHWTQCPNIVQIYLPSYLIALKSGKRVDTVAWLGIHAKKDGDVFLYKDKLILSVKTNRLAQFL